MGMRRCLVGDKSVKVSPGLKAYSERCARFARQETERFRTSNPSLAAAFEEAACQYDQQALGEKATPSVETDGKEK